MIRVFLVAFLFVFFYSDATAQDLTYDIYVRNKSVGEIMANKQMTSEGICYSLKSQATFSLIFSIEYSYLIKSVYSDDVLTMATAENMINDKVKASSTTKHNGTNYQIKLLEEKGRTINSPITFSMINLYFKEPKDVRKVYSERYGEFFQLTSMEESKYRVALPDGKEITYSYKDGRCVEVSVDHTFANVYFRLRENTSGFSSY